MGKAKETNVDRSSPYVTDVAQVLGAANVAQIDEAIAERQGQIEKINGEIRALKLVRRSVDAFKNGCPKRTVKRKPKPAADAPAPTASSGSGSGQDAWLGRVVNALGKLGAATPANIAEVASMSVGLVVERLENNRERFAQQAGGLWKLR